MIITILFLFCQTEMYGQQNMLEFAEHLYSQQDYAAALHEYRRIRFLADSVGDELYERMIDCLARLGRYDEAVGESENIKDINRRNYVKGVIYFASGAVDSSRAYLHLTGVPYAHDARRMIGLGYAYEFRFSEAGIYIDLPQNMPSYKNPAVGAFLSIFPGGGHFYAGRMGDGFYSLIIVSAVALLSYYYYDRDEDIKFGFSLGTAILLYAGNIYGGINAVRNYNYHENERYLEQILHLMQPDVE